jgi:hypothetical protein
MIRAGVHATIGIAALVTVMIGGIARLNAQDTAAVELRFGPPSDADTFATNPTVPDSVLRVAIARFNAVGTIRVLGGFQYPTGVISGTLGINGGDARIGGEVQGDLLVINGDLRLESTSRVRGDVIVLGGQLFRDPGAVVDGSIVSHSEYAAVRQTPAGLLEPLGAVRSLRDLTGIASLAIGPVDLAPRLGVGVYNRVEGLPLRIGPSLRWRAQPEVLLGFDAEMIFRTASEPSGQRGEIGWWARLEATRTSTQPITVGLEGFNVVTGTATSPVTPTEEGLAALLLRRDYRDWYGTKGIGAFVRWEPTPVVSLTARVAVARDRSVPAVDAFSLFGGNDPWRANPLIDDGKFTTTELIGQVDTRDDRDWPRTGWLARMSIRRTTSGDITPVPLPEQIRDPLPASGYEALEAHVDLRHNLQFNLKHSLHLRLLAGGWLGGDPLTVQRRLAVGGDDPFPGYPFRFVTCDSRRRPDPAQSALCDRQIVLQAEFRRNLGLRIGTRLGSYGVGIEQADLVIFGDFGSAWIAGDQAGQVPSNRIQSIGEWKSDFGIGLDAGLVGIYVSKAIADNTDPRFTLRLQRRF